MNFFISVFPIKLNQMQFYSSKCLVQLFSFRWTCCLFTTAESLVVIHLSILLLSVEIRYFHVLMGNVVKYIINMT